MYLETREGRAEQQPKASGPKLTPNVAGATKLLRAGDGEPLFLLHGVTGSATMWRRVVPLLAAQHDVIAPTSLGHRGGTPVELRPARVEHLVDEVERHMDALGFERAHLVGNSLGGWIALEVARRGRANSVCAFSPAGTWPENTQHGAERLRAVRRKARATRPMMPWLANLGFVRRIALQENACHGERVTPEELLELIDDLLACTVHEDVFATPEQLAPLRASCPITIAWARADQILPLESCGLHARELVPDAHHLVLDDVGHVPMLDNPQLVADTILDAVARSRA